jgi:acetylornithine aminotransferase
LTLPEKESEYFFQTYNRLPLEIEKGEGVYLYTKEGGKYLDMVGGLAVNVLGYGNEKVVKAITEQAEKYIHLSNLFLQEPQVKFAEKLLQLSGFNKVFLASTGTEAIEGAIKLVRKYQAGKNKPELISFKGGFHGRTYGSLSLTPKLKYKQGHEPFLPDTRELIYNSIEDLENNINENTAAVFIEPIQGEGGVNVASDEFVSRLNMLKHRFGFLIAADCIQSGAGRTGTFTSLEQIAINADICVMAKGIGGGLPLGALMATEELAGTWKPGEHGTTFGGNPVACAAGLAVLEQLEESVMQNAMENGAYLREKLVSLKHQYPGKIKDVRGLGFMLGIELQNTDPAEVIQKFFEKKILVNLTNENVIRLLPPLILDEEDINFVISVFSRIL